MLKKLFTALTVCVAAASAVAVADESDNAELTALNKEVQKRVALLRDKHNIIATQADEDQLKKLIIVEKLQADDSAAGAGAKVDAAVSRYEITDPVEQQDIIIMYVFGSGGGAAPPQ